MDSSWDTLDGDSPSPQPPPLPAPLGQQTTTVQPVNNQQQFASQPQPQQPSNLPPPVFPHQYFPSSSNDPRASTAIHQQYSSPSSVQQVNNNGNYTYQSPYSYSPFRNNRRPIYDARNNGVISKIADEKTRSAFNSIEVVLDTFSSLSAVLENTYSAIHGSFKTITNVADHLIFLRNHLAELALLPRAFQVITRFVRWMLQAFGLGKSALAQKIETRLNEQLWQQSLVGPPGEDDIDKFGESPSSSAWPILAFISLVLGTPYLLRRLLGAPPEVIPKTNRPEWTTKSGNHYVAVGIHDFVARNQNELSFTKDAVLFIKPESMQPGSKWFIATLAADTQQSLRKSKSIGLVPVNYVRLLMK